jgi:EAL and modified HD-GYP domain-containing signal transduction protein
VAQKVESREEFKAALDGGFDLFQGYFFSRPELLSINDINVSKQGYMRLLQAVYNPELDFPTLEQIIKSDAALCYRLLRYMNSALFCAQSGVSSIRHALMLLGEREIRRWIVLTTVVLAAEEGPGELVKLAMLRASFAELLACHARVQPYHAFLLGLFSLMDAILNVPLPTIIQRVEIPAEVAAALSGKAGRLHRLLTLIETYEKAKWADCQETAEGLGLQENLLPDSYREALGWVDRVMG